MCRCFGCKNYEESQQRKTLMHLADAAEVRVLQQVAANSKLSTPVLDRPSNRAASSIAGRRYDFSDGLCSVACAKGKKVKVHILDIASLLSKTPTQKHSGMARSLGISPFYLHTHTFFRSRNEPYLPLPSQL